jgi:hypothetical protein
MASAKVVAEAAQAAARNESDKLDHLSANGACFRCTCFSHFKLELRRMGNESYEDGPVNLTKTLLISLLRFFT